MKIALGVEYFGKDFHGWQVQKSDLRTVQSCVELALTKEKVSDAITLELPPKI